MSELDLKVPEGFRIETSKSQSLANKLFIGGLAYSISKQALFEYLSQYGKILDFTIKIHPKTGFCRGFGFVIFKDSATVEKVLQVKEHTVNGRKFELKRAEALQLKPGPRKVFVGGMNPQTSEAELRQFFQKFGNIETIHLPVCPKTNERRGFCFVTYANETAVKKLLRSRFYLIGARWCEVKIAIEKTIPKYKPKQGSNVRVTGLANHLGEQFPTNPNAPGVIESDHEAAEVGENGLGAGGVDDQDGCGAGGGGVNQDVPGASGGDQDVCGAGSSGDQDIHGPSSVNQDVCGADDCNQDVPGASGGDQDVCGADDCNQDVPGASGGDQDVCGADGCNQDVPGASGGDQDVCGAGGSGDQDIHGPSSVNQDVCGAAKVNCNVHWAHRVNRSIRGAYQVNCNVRGVRQVNHSVYGVHRVNHDVRGASSINQYVPGVNHNVHGVTTNIANPPMVFPVPFLAWNNSFNFSAQIYGRFYAYHNQPIFNSYIGSPIFGTQPIRILFSNYQGAVFYRGYQGLYRYF